jgi:hypothetical protein
MRETRITIPELALVAGTRAALGAGLGLLLADRLSKDRRKAVGWTLCLIGGLSTIPLALKLFSRSLKALPSRMESTDMGQPGGGRGRVDVTGIMPEGIRVDPNLTEGHPGYQESGDSEIIPSEGLVHREKDLP